MLADTLQLHNLEDLRKFVYETLNQHDQLEPGAFPMTERILLRAGNACGIFFCLHGPRSVKTTAIWETDRNTILFYSSTGERIGKISLAQAPRLAATQMAATPAA